MAQTSRADLLLALHLGVQGGLALEHDDRHWWGYAPTPQAPPPPPELPAMVELPQPPPPAGPPDTPAEAEPLRPPLQMPVAWALREQTARDLPRELQGLPALTAADLGALAADPLPYQDLVPWARVLPGLRRQTDRPVPGAVHWPRLAQAVARRETPRRLPREAWARWPPHLTLVLDFSPRLDPYRHDFHRLAQQLDARLPPAALSVRVLCHGPGGPWLAWRHPRKPEGPAHLHDWEAHGPPNRLVLLASDLGLFDPQPATREAWRAWAGSLRRQGARVVALAPLSPQQITPDTLARVELLRWSPDSRWRRERQAAAAVPTGDNAPEQDDAPLAALLALAATAVRVDPPLLRAWRRLLPAGGDAGLEGRLWNHPHVQAATLTCATRSEHLDADLARHAGLPATLREAARAIHREQHAHLRRGIGQAEALRWHAAEGPTAGWAQAAANEPLDFVRRLVHSLHEGPEATSPTLQRRLLGAADLVRTAASLPVRALDPALFDALDAAAARWRRGLEGGAVQGEGEGASDRWWALVQRGDDLRFEPADPRAPGQAFGAPVRLPADTRGIWLAGADSRPQGFPLGSSGATLLDLGRAPASLRLGAGGHAWALERVERPRWAEQWGQVGGRLSATVPSPVLGPLGARDSAWFEFPWPMQSPVAVANGRVTIALDACGAYAEIPLQAPAGQRKGANVHLPLRFRWIPPGLFQMGSPDGIGYDDEHPQHPVHISQGFWLAEGPCTQWLWTLVMGENPSDFKDAPDAGGHPVENVSFEDVQRFLERIAGWLPNGCRPALPTEAEWEYAARADTLTAYPWGDEPDDARANWNQQHGGTTPVGRFPPNPWGLLDMHGNVWEWCADSRRDYSREVQRDPHGQLEGPPWRAVRGGLWFSRPGDARSAYRDAWHPGTRDRGLGFRLALRSPAPGAGGPPAEPASGPGGASAGAGRPGGEANFLVDLASRVRDALRRKKS